MKKTTHSLVGAGLLVAVIVCVWAFRSPAQNVSIAATVRVVQPVRQVVSLPATAFITTAQTQPELPSQPSAPAHPELAAAYPSITDAVTDWHQFGRQARSITVAPYSDLPLTFERVALQDADSGYLTWIGRNKGIPGASLVSVATPSGGFDSILIVPGSSQFAFHTDPDGHTFITESQPGEEGCAVDGTQPNRTTAQAPASSAIFKAEYTAAASFAAASGYTGDDQFLGALAAANDGSKVDVLFTYDAETLSDASALSSDPAGYIDGQAAAIIASGNVVLAQSGVTNFQWRYIGATRLTAYTRPVAGTATLQADLAAISPTGAAGAAVTALAYSRGADQVVFFRGRNVTGATGAGIANSLKQTPVAKNNARAVIIWASSYKAVIHELAHNFGAQHDRDHGATNPDSSTAPVPDNDGFYCYGQLWSVPSPIPGFVDTASTLMGYGSAVIPYFSNPGISVRVTSSLAQTNGTNDWGTQQLGQPVGNAKAAYNVKVLTDNAPSISAQNEEIDAPTITTQPSNVNVPAGGSLSLTVVASGGGLSYQWSKDGAAINGATAAIYSKTAASGDAGSYTVTVSNSVGQATSSAASVTVSAAPTGGGGSSGSGGGGGGGGAPSHWFFGALLLLALARKSRLLRVTFLGALVSTVSVRAQVNEYVYDTYTNSSSQDIQRVHLLYTEYSWGDDPNWGSWETTWSDPNMLGSVDLYPGQSVDLRKYEQYYWTANYIGTESVNYVEVIGTVGPPPKIHVDFSPSPLTFTYNGGSQGPNPNPNPGDATFDSIGTASASEAGTYYLKLVGNGNYEGESETATWTIEPKNVNFSFGQTTFQYDGQPHGPEVYPDDGSASYNVGGTPTATEPGTYTITADAYGNYSGSGSTSYTIEGKLSQTISFSNPGTQTYGGLPVSLSASASSGLPVSFSLVSGSATLSGSTLTPTAAGSITVRASQAGNSSYDPAPDVTVTFAVNPKQVTFSLNQTTYTFTGAAHGPAVVASDPAATFTTGGTLSATNAGSYTATATATGNYSGTNNALTWSITKANQGPVTITSQTSILYGAKNAYTATASGGAGTGALVWSLGTGSTATGAAIHASAGTVTASEAGTVVINVYRAGDANYNPSAPSADFTVSITQRFLTITLSGNKNYDGSTAPSGATAQITSGSLAATGDAISYTYTEVPSANAGTYTGLVSATINNPSSPTNRTSSYVYTYTGSYTINKASQTITFPNPGTQTYGTPVALTATASSGLPVTYAVTSGPATLSGSTLTPTGTGSVTVQATQAGNANFNAATNVAVTFTINPKPVTFSLNQTSFTYTGTAQGPTVVASDAAATFTTGGTLSATNAGSYTATATATGNYSGTNNALTWSINKAAQTISFPNPGTQTYGTPVALTATASSGLPVTYAVTSGPATLSGSTLTPTGTGSVTVQATQAGNANFNAATNVSVTFPVNPKPVTFSLNQTTFTYTGSVQGPTVIASDSSATFTTGGTLSATNASSYTATATANGNYSGSNTGLLWTIGTAAQTITLNPLTATINAGQSVTFTASGGHTSYEWGASASGSGSSKVVSFPNAGTFTVTVRDAGNANWAPSATLSATVTVNPLSQVVTLSPMTLAAKVGLNYTFTASGGNTTYIWGASAAGSGATKSLSWGAVGNYTVTVYAAADATYSASNTVTANVTVTPAAYQLTTNVSGAGSITPGGSFPADSWVSITATPTAVTRFKSWTGDAAGTLNPVAVQMVSDKSVTALFESKYPQSITFPNPSPVAHDTDVLLSATASSGLPVSYLILSGDASLLGSVLHVGNSGTVRVQASQAGNTDYLPAPSVTIDIVVYAKPRSKITSDAARVQTSTNDNKGAGQIIINK